MLYRSRTSSIETLPIAYSSSGDGSLGRCLLVRGLLPPMTPRLNAPGSSFRFRGRNFTARGKPEEATAALDCDLRCCCDEDDADGSDGLLWLPPLESLIPTLPVDAFFDDFWVWAPRRAPLTREVS